MEATVALVRGRARQPIPASQVRAAASSFRRVVVDVGTGDGRWVYRMARAHPDWFCLGTDANADALRKASFRASRKPSRGGASNAWFICAAVETLPRGLEGLADQITIFYPWGRLLDGFLIPDVALLRPIALLGKAGAHIVICMNDSALSAWTSDAIPRESAVLLRRLAPKYAEAGIVLTACELTSGPQTTWGKRVGQGRPAPSMVLMGIIRSAASADISKARGVRCP